MNIFVLSEDPLEAAEMLCNKHVPKMIVESAQMLCSALVKHKHVEQYKVPYKATHFNHPCTKWVALSTSNSTWLMCHALQMCEEYTKRYKKIHKTQKVFFELYERFPNEYKSNWSMHTPFALAMPDEYKCDNAVESYRRFYMKEKSKFAKWEPNTKIPAWWNP
jgi:hypothetical protein